MGNTFSLVFSFLLNGKRFSVRFDKVGESDGRAVDLMERRLPLLERVFFILDFTKYGLVILDIEHGIVFSVEAGRWRFSKAQVPAVDRRTASDKSIPLEHNTEVLFPSSHIDYGSTAERKNIVFYDIVFAVVLMIALTFAVINDIVFNRDSVTAGVVINSPRAVASAVDIVNKVARYHRARLFA